jgi:predicted transcriptional regulator of viral defense system
MGKQKYLRKIEELFRKSPVVEYSSIERIVRENKKKNEYAKQLVRNLILRGEIRRLTQGRYTSYKNPEFIVFCFKPAYLGLQDALGFHNLWEQETIPIVITTGKIRGGVREIKEMKFMIRRMSKKYFFGFDYLKSGDFYIPYSNIEKTFIDMVYFREKISEETLENIKQRADKKKINLYLKRYPLKLRKKVENLLD